MALLGLAGVAVAADLPTMKPAPSPPIVSAFNWSGFYIGVQGGGAWGPLDWTYAAGGKANQDTSGGIVGGTIGYNFQFGSIVAGLEGDYAWADVKRGTSCPSATFSCQSKLDSLGTARLRLGYAIDRLLVYATGGLAFGEERVQTVYLPGGAIPPSGTSTNGSSSFPVGGAIGGGLEYAFTNNLSAKVEALYYDLGSKRYFVDNSFAVSARPSGTIVRAGLNWRF